MKTRPCVFNGFLALGIIVFVVACSTSEERKRKKEVSNLRIHVESDPGSSDRASAISVHRAAPVLLNIDREAVLDESEVTVATVTGQPGGVFSVEIQFTRRGGWILERTTVASRGKHLAIFSQFGNEARWLAAPLITAKNSSGRLVFTPDATREEAERSCADSIIWRGNWSGTRTGRSRGRWINDTGERSKIQDPRSREAPNSKLQCSRAYRAR